MLWSQYKWSSDIHTCVLYMYHTIACNTLASLNSDDGLGDLTGWWRFTTWLPPCAVLLRVHPTK